jgi:hypothetical protein
MTYRDVESLIGPPLCLVFVSDSRLNDPQKKAAEDLIRDCGPLQRTARPVPPTLTAVAELSLSYAEPRESFTNPNIYVNFKAGHVVSVYIKKDDFGICCMDGLPTSPFYWIGSRQVLRDLIGR